MNFLSLNLLLLYKFPVCDLPEIPVRRVDRELLVL